MKQPTAPFRVRVVNPALPEEKGGLKKGDILVVRDIYMDATLQGVFVFFLVWNKSVGRFMLEPSVQFEPLD